MNLGNTNCKGDNMKVIVPTNNKGGVGKTKVSILLMEYLSSYLKKRVLAIDFDPQCNLSRRFLDMENDPVSPEGVVPPPHPDYDSEDLDSKNWDGRSTIADIFYTAPFGVLPYATPLPNLDIMPGHAEKLLTAEAVRKVEVLEKVHNRLTEFLALGELQELYDVVVIDTAPSKGPLTIAAVKTATHLVIPCVMEEQPIQGVYGMLQLWMQESLRREAGRPLNLIGILPNMFRQINLHRDMLQSLRENEGVSKFIMPVKLSQRAVFAEVDAEGASPTTVFDLPDDNIAKKEALEVCQYITERVFEND
jgi:chromosome partitioning protein